MDNSLIGRWVSISWHRPTESVDFFAFDVGVVTDVKNRNVFVDYKDDGVHSVTDIQKSEHTWHMLAKKTPMKK